jgi:ATP synthase protein I
MKFLPFMLASSAVLAVVGAVAGFLHSGWSGAAGVTAGVAFIALVYTLSTVFIVWVERKNRPMMLPAALGAYGFKLVALIVLLGALRQWDGVRPMVFGVAGAALLWIVAQMWWISHAKIPYVDLSETN